VIRLVTFDLYQTLVYSQPSRNERLAEICRGLGHACHPDDFVRANVLAEELYTVENGRLALHTRPEAERARFYAEMWGLLLREAGLPHDRALVARVQAAIAARQDQHRWVLYDDAPPTFAALRARGMKLGVVSNTSRDATLLCTEVGVCERVDFVVSSCLVGCEKPGGRIFEVALEQAGVAPDEAVHVGDQPRSDALGATRAGMHALLLDRLGLLGHERYERVSSLPEVVDWVDGRLP
jgi:HAD superfamily hydrolase (TIGR01549 family)